MSAPRAWIERVRIASDIVEVVDATVRLKRVGCNLTGLCPFHREKTPSFTVSPERGLYHCFGCGAGGDVFRFVQATETVSFLEAVELLAQRAGIRMPGVPIRDPAPRTGPRPRSPQLEPSRPPRDEVERLWRRCSPLAEDRVVVDWLAGRGLDPLKIADRDFARALPASGLPQWARCSGATWFETGHRCVVPLYGSTGELESLHIRAVRPGVEPKGLFPARYQIGGLLMADGAGRHMLESTDVAGPLWIVEGVPDYLSAATAWGDAADPTPAVIGIVAGSWKAEIAARVPTGARVVVAVHHDQAGERYARGIARSLQGRARLKRWVPT